ncbi:MAG: type II/IV secretion system protein [Clostridia bacterium]|nr:type II/IV secretion system protein [Clostridia bacterium]MBR4032602.1 type II/IV secretion system protein [Clostridia bacterium]
MNINRDLLQFYIYKKIIKKKQANQILEDCERLKVSVRDYMLTKEYTTEVKELPVLGGYYCLPYVEIDMLDIDKSLFDMFTFEFMKRYKIIPVSMSPEGKLLIATGNPLDCAAMSAISSQIVCPTDYVLVPPGQIDRYIDSIAVVMSTSAALNDLNTEGEAEMFSNKKAAADEDVVAENDVVNNPSVRLVDSIIREAVPYRASDIHIEPFEKVVKVRYRIDGDLQERAEFPINSYSAICARIKIMAGLDIAERRIPQDGRIDMVIGGKEFDFRVSSLPTMFGEKFVIRVLDKTSFRFTREDLGFTEHENVYINKMLSKPHGIILLTGPTGCGKSTTLYSFLKEVNTSAVNIVTVEDPVEYVMHGINQTQVNAKANMTFATALRSILRQDPDIIMIGEMRDEETAEIAVRAAITGHLVFSTLHTNDATGAITRLEDMGIADYLVADALVGVIAQRLVKRLCPECRRRSKTTPKEMQILGIDEPISIYRPQGCQFCNHTGYKGRIAVHEIMYMNENMRNAVSHEKNLEVLRDLARQNGMVTLWSSCRNLVVNGVTSIQELMTLNVE